MKPRGLKPGEGGYSILLWALLALFVLRPMLHGLVNQTWLLPFILTIVLLACVWVVSRNTLHLIGMAIVVMIAVSGELCILVGYELNRAIPALAGMIAFAWIAIAFAKDVFRERHRVSGDMIYGAINIYLLVAVVFAEAHMIQALLVPGSIEGLSIESTLGDALYYSAITITTLGYGDIVPVSDSARMLASTEALFGQFYIAIMLAQLVATYISGKAGKDDGC